MRITSKEIFTEDNQGTIILQTQGTTRLTIDGTGVAIFSASATDQAGARLVGTAGGTTTISAASAATAGSTSALSSFTLPHGLSVTPTNFGAKAANLKAGLAELLGSYVTADGTNVYVNTASSVTASSAYSWQWWATP